MASIAAATTDNNDGIAGVAYDGVSVMPVKVLDADGTGNDSDIITGLVWAADHGADVALMSFSNPGYSQALQDAVDYAWSRGVVVVAAVGNDGVTTPTYPAGDEKVVGVAATDETDALWSGSNSGADTFISAPGVGIAADGVGGGTVNVTGTSASAAIVAGAAALLKANDPSSPGVILGRLARNTDAGGDGNGRLNLARSLSDTSTDPVVPVGAPGGGPIVGPYVIAAPVSGSLQGQNNPACVSPSPCPWQTSNLSGWGELQTAPIRLLFGANQSTNTVSTFDIAIDRAAGGTQGLESLQFVSKTSNVTMSAITFSSSTNGAGATTWTYSFTVDMTDNNAGEIRFSTRLLAGAHNFTGASLQIKGAGTLSFIKPTAAPGAPNLVLTKTALTAVAPGQTMTYTLSYQNTASGSGTTNQATGVQITDVLPAEVTYVPNSCTGCTYDSLSRTLSWEFGSIPAGSALATKTYQVTVGSTLTNNTQFTNDAKILSAENDANVANNASKVTTTVFTPSISGTVLTDPNGDGTDQGDGSGLAGATITLYVDTNTNGTYNAGTDLQVGAPITTPSSGEWAFTSGLVKNTTYFVRRTNPSWLHFDQGDRRGRCGRDRPFHRDGDRRDGR